MKTHVRVSNASSFYRSQTILGWSKLIWYVNFVPVPNILGQDIRMLLQKYFHSIVSNTSHDVVQKNLYKVNYLHYSLKGQIISKGLFGVLEFSQKMNKRICHRSKNEFVRSFFGRIRGYQKSFRNYLTFTKVQLILKWLFGVFNFPKNQCKNLMNFCPRI